MERSITIKYHWTRNEGDGEVLEHHKEYLEESALDRIAEQMKDGMWCGELHDNIHCAEDPDDHEGTEYSGWWTTSKE